MSTMESRFDTGFYRIEFHHRFFIAPISDIHHNDPMCSRQALRRWCDRCKRLLDAGEQVLFFGGGDYLETMGQRERMDAMPKMKDSTAEIISDKIEEDAEKLAKVLAFTKGRWIGMLSGNHNYVHTNNLTTTELLAQKLDAYAYGVCANIRLRCEHKGGRKYIGYYDIWAHHGKGGGRTAGATLNSLATWGYQLDGDLILMGHDHKAATTPIPRLKGRGEDENYRLVEQEMALARMGSFKRSYVPGKASYAVRQAMPPVSLRAPLIQVTLVTQSRDRENRIQDSYLYTEVTV